MILFFSSVYVYDDGGDGGGDGGDGGGDIGLEGIVVVERIVSSYGVRMHVVIRQTIT